MSFDLLSTSGINSLIQSYKQNEVNKRLQPLQEKKTAYENKNTGYSDLSSKLDSLKTILKTFQNTGSDSVFAYKSAKSSNTDFISATSTSSAVVSSYQMRTSQLAKNDSVLTSNFTSATSNALTGTHTFEIKTGDGSTGEYLSNISVDFVSGETNATALEKIQDAINSDKAEISSAALNATSTFTGSGSFDIDLNGTTTSISYNYSSQTYDSVIDDLVTQINDNTTGITAEKVTNGSNVNLKLTVNDSSKYITIDQTTDTGTLLGASNLDINVSKEKGASGIVTASLFTPTSGESQLSITSDQTGLDNRIKSLLDTGTGTALNTFGLNIGTSRPTFDQSTTPDTVGFIYSDITTANNQLNSKFTFNGIDMQRNTNTISDVVTGTTFTLNSEMQTSDKDVSISVESDVPGIKSKLEDYISKFNDAYTYIKEQTTSSSGYLKNDSNASSLLSTFRTFGYADVSGIPSGDLQRLSQIGISFSTSTGLSISDSTLLESEIKGNTAQVESLFNSTNGIANDLYNTIDPFLGIDGYLANTQSSISSNITYFTDKIDATSTRIDKSAEVLRSSYQKLQIQLASLIQNSSYLNSVGGGGYF